MICKSPERTRVVDSATIFSQRRNGLDTNDARDGKVGEFDDVASRTYYNLSKHCTANSCLVGLDNVRKRVNLIFVLVAASSVAALDFALDDNWTVITIS